MTTARVLSALGGLLLLGGCGAIQGLTPAKGKSLPVKPASAPTQPSSDDRLVQWRTVKPGRSDELMIKSQPRQDDRFDLPPH